MSYELRLDRNACTGHGDCVEIAPEAFELGEDGIARVIGTAPDETLLAAAGACPSVAIILVDSNTGEEIYP